MEKDFLDDFLRSVNCRGVEVLDDWIRILGLRIISMEVERKPFPRGLLRVLQAIEGSRVAIRAVGGLSYFGRSPTDVL